MPVHLAYISDNHSKCYLIINSWKIGYDIRTEHYECYEILYKLCEHDSNPGPYANVVVAELYHETITVK